MYREKNVPPDPDLISIAGLFSDCKTLGHAEEQNFGFATWTYVQWVPNWIITKISISLRGVSLRPTFKKKVPVTKKKKKTLLSGHTLLF